MSAAARKGRLDQLPATEPFEGVTRRRVDGDKCTLLLYSFAPNASHGLHSHDEEQLMIVTAGSLALHGSDGAEAVAAGEYCFVSAGVEHGVKAGEDGVQFTVVLAPARTGGYVTRPLPQASAPQE